MKAPVIILIALALSGCGMRDIATGVAALGGVAASTRAAADAPAAQMKQDDLQARVRLATVSADRMTEAFQSGKLPIATSPDTAHPKFCDMVLTDIAQIGDGDQGGEALALGCKIKHHLYLAKAAFEGGDVIAYTGNIAKADAYMNDLNRIVATARGTAE